MAYIRFLSGVQLDNSYNNPIYFSNNGSIGVNNIVKITYNDYFSQFDANWNERGTPVNFSFGDGINTSLVVSSTYFNPSNNYAIVMLDDNDMNICYGKNNKPTTYFYFVTSFAIYGKNNYRVELELDVMTTFLQTLYIDSDVFVERKHCNRWGDTLLNFKDAILGDEIDGSFNASVPSKIIYPEYNLIDVNDVVSSDYATINNILKNTLWVYLFFTDLPQGKSDKPISHPLLYRGAVNGKQNNVSTQVSCVAVPCRNINIYNKKLNETYVYGIDTDEFRDLVEYPSCIGAKLSFRSPFNNRSRLSDDVYYNGSLVIPFNMDRIATSGDSGSPYVQEGVNGNLTCNYVIKNTNETELGDLNYWLYMCVTSYDDIKLESDSIDLYKELEIETYDDYKLNVIDNIVPKVKNAEPKLYCKPYYNLLLSSQFGSYYNYNPLLFNSVECKVVVYCSLSPEPDKIYTYVKTDDVNSPYYYQKDLNIGSVLINDNNIPYRQDAYATYLATHRASYLTSLAVPVIDNLTGVATSNSPVWAKAVQGALKTTTTAISWYSNIVDLKNTPDTIKNLGNNPIHDFMMENSLYPYLYVLKLFENEENQVYQYYYDNGYCINRENTFNLHHFDKESILTRRLFNYIKLNENIVSKMVFRISGLGGVKVEYYVPQSIKNKINNILNKGCKIWTLMKNASSVDVMTQYYLTNEFENSEIIM